MRTRHSPILEQLESRLLMSSGPALADIQATAQPVQAPPIGQVDISGDLSSQTQQSYLLTTHSRGQLTLSLAANSATAPDLVIYNNSGRRIRSVSGQRLAGHALKLSVGNGGIFYVLASEAGNAGQYTLTLASKPVDDYGNTADKAKKVRLTAKGAGRLGGVVNYDGDTDLLAFVATRSGLVTARMLAGGIANPLSPTLTVLEADGQRVPSAEPSSVTTFAVTKGQTYYVLAAGDNGASGRYMLSIQTNDAPAPPPAPPDTGPVLPGIVPGQAVTSQVVSVNGSSQLWILGTDSADAITVTQNANGIVVITGAGSTTYVDQIDGIVMCGFAGADTLRLTNAVTISAQVYGGDGDDRIFDAGTGADTLYGQAGQDLIVAIGGSWDTIYGGDGNDSLWYDSTDLAADASAAEDAGGFTHCVSAFFQPTGWAPVPLEIAGQALAEPQPTADASGYADFSAAPLFVDGPRYNDIIQGYVGDCYLMATLSSIADTSPQTIRQMITPLGDGSFAVRFYRDGQQVYVRLDGDLPINAAGDPMYAKLTPQGELWVALAEKAYAMFRTGAGAYDSLNDGWTGESIEAITGLASDLMATSATDQQLTTFMQEALDAGHAVTVASRFDSTSPIQPSHSYQVKSVETVNGATVVTVYNPWGQDGAAWDSYPDDGLLKLPMSLLRQDFLAVVIAA